MMILGDGTGNLSMMTTTIQRTIGMKRITITTGQSGKMIIGDMNKAMKTKMEIKVRGGKIGTNKLNRTKEMMIGGKTMNGTLVMKMNKMRTKNNRLEIKMDKLKIKRKEININFLKSKPTLSNKFESIIIKRSSVPTLPMPLKSTGPKLEQPHMSKTREFVVVAGLTVRLVLLKLTS